ncbi:hypothetical protein D7D52_17120 [Nocardia yunnanensis]|uniref:Uncharacterized protein n=1 Tax=Nocardia yunnanensis TaxID=2382165 RepID=A0A386ZD89_9NOCA|nr:hypothetical protein [Nocardia yunnanensis]AYF75307.1 hypothetical protein D7D52_17120 [Nocardia yunnanensis]
MSTTANQIVHVEYPGGARFVYRIPVHEIEAFVAAARLLGVWVSIVRELRPRHLRSVPTQAAA